jgi:N-acetylglucosamine kinase-like BadF-type ATPase
VRALAIDAGQTEVRAALVLGGERTVARGPGVPRIGADAGPDDVAAALLRAVAGLGSLPDPRPPAAVGLSGMEAAGAEELRRIHSLVCAELGLERVPIAGDGLASLLGALGARDGAVVAAGTGAVALARRGARLAKVDGWGSLLGDAGSGFAIGRAGLDAALRRADGRGGSERLLAAATERFGPPAELPARVYGAPVPTREVAGFAADVAALARAGELAAVVILRDAGRELAVSACAAIGRLFEPGEPALVSHAGGVFRAGELLLEPFRLVVAARRPDAEVVPPAGDAVDGAALLAGGGLGLAPEPGLLWQPS